VREESPEPAGELWDLLEQPFRVSERRGDLPRARKDDLFVERAVVRSFLLAGPLSVKLLPEPVSLRDQPFKRRLGPLCSGFRIVARGGRLGHAQSSSASDAERRRNVQTLSTVTPTNTAAGSNSSV